MIIKSGAASTFILFKGFLICIKKMEGAMQKKKNIYEEINHQIIDKSDRCDRHEST